MVTANVIRVEDAEDGKLATVRVNKLKGTGNIIQKERARMAAIAEVGLADAIKGLEQPERLTSIKSVNELWETRAGMMVEVKVLVEVEDA
jgi:hypothetical protein